MYCSLHHGLQKNFSREARIISSSSSLSTDLSVPMLFSSRVSPFYFLGFGRELLSVGSSVLKLCSLKRLYRVLQGWKGSSPPGLHWGIASHMIPAGHWDLSQLPAQDGFSSIRITATGCTSKVGEKQLPSVTSFLKPIHRGVSSLPNWLSSAPILRVNQLLPGTGEVACASHRKITSVADIFPLHQKSIIAKPAYQGSTGVAVLALHNCK